MKKLVLCTLFDSINCGTFLQAYSLKKFFEDKGFDVYFLSLKGNAYDVYESTKNVSKQHLSFKEFIIKFIRKVKLKLVFKKSCSFFKTINLFELNNDSKIKYVVIGSDELWNVRNNSFKHYKEYFGYNFCDKTVIAYAPSVNDTTITDLKKMYGVVDFSNFDKLSCRDKKTMKLLEKAGFSDVVEVLDPTMIVDGFDDIIEPIKLNKYIVVYGHSFTETQKKAIMNFAKNHNLKTVSITKYFSWCDKNIVASPGQFLSYIKNADYVITSTFHGTVFSILFKKNFVVYLNNGSKISDLLEKFELNDRIGDNREIEAVISEKIDYLKLDELKEYFKNISINYLDASLNDEYI